MVFSKFLNSCVWSGGECIHKILEGDMIHLKNKMNTSCQQFIKTPVILIIVSFSASAFSYLFLFASCTSTNQWLKGMLRMQADEQQL